MGVRRLQIGDFRCLRAVDAEFCDRVNLIEGENASGKTSLLEAIYLLGRGRSFRSTRPSSLIRDGSPRFTVVGWLRSAAGGERVAGVSGSASEGLEARLGGNRVRGLADLAEALPVQHLDPDVHKLVEEGPARRRRFLDWGVFHVEHAFIAAWRRFRKANQQRNVLLRNGAADSVIVPWEMELAAAATEVDAARERYAALLQEASTEIGQALMGQTLVCDYRRGWPRDQELADCLARNRTRDREYGAAQAGPHRADLGLQLAGRVARGRVSRGQQKLVSAAMTLAQMRILHEQRGEPGVLLLDDPEAELDPAHVNRLLDLACALPLQLFVTQLPGRSLPLPGDTRRFHVEHGELLPVV